MTNNHLDLAVSMVNRQYKIQIYRKYRIKLDIRGIAFPIAASLIQTTRNRGCVQFRITGSRFKGRKRQPCEHACFGVEHT